MVITTALLSQKLGKVGDDVITQRLLAAWLYFVSDLALGLGLWDRVATSLVRERAKFLFVHVSCLGDTLFLGQVTTNLFRRV